MCHVLCAITNPVSQHFAATVADGLEDLLDLLDEARVEDRFGKFDVTKVARAFRHVLSASLALELAINRSKQRIVQAAVTRLGSRLVHCLRVDDMSHTHVLDLFRRQETKLDLLDRLERRTRVRKVKVRHAGR